MFHKILVPLDGTPEAEKALETACQLTRLCSASLVLARVLVAPADLSHTMMHLMAPGLSAAEQQACADYLESCAVRLRNQGFDARAVTLHDDVVEHGLAILLQSEKPDLIVMNTHESEGMFHFLSDSVAAHLVKTAGCPVLVTGECAQHRPYNHSLAALSSDYRNK